MIALIRKPSPRCQPRQARRLGGVSSQLFCTTALGMNSKIALVYVCVLPESHDTPRTCTESVCLQTNPGGKESHTLTSIFVRNLMDLTPPSSLIHTQLNLWPDLILQTKPKCPHCDSTMCILGLKCIHTPPTSNFVRIFIMRDLTLKSNPDHPK